MPQHCEEVLIVGAVSIFYIREEIPTLGGERRRRNQAIGDPRSAHGVGGRAVTEERDFGTAMGSKRDNRLK